jgi:hypothetical protein
MQNSVNDLFPFSGTWVHPLCKIVVKLSTNPFSLAVPGNSKFFYSREDSVLIDDKFVHFSDLLTDFRS